jgi:prepilin-type N-terminal cleavage/methylation domain-containing protein
MQREHLDARAADTGEKGFTLIELMVVVLIIAILIAIAIPQFIGARVRANDRATQSNLRNALTAEKTVYTDTQKYYVDSTAVKLAEPSLPWGTKLLVQVGTNLDPNDTVCLSELSDSGSWFAIGDVANASGAAANGTYFEKSPTDPCTTDPAIISGWPTGW